MFETFEHKADMGVRGVGKSREEAFGECAKAMFSVMVDLKGVEAKDEVEVKVTAYNLEQLLVEFLNELLYLRDVHEMVFSEFRVERIKRKQVGYALEGKASGEKIGEKHEVNTEVKAATYSGLKVEKEGIVWKAQCIVDV